LNIKKIFPKCEPENTLIKFIQNRDWKIGERVIISKCIPGDWQIGERICIPGDWKTGERVIISKCIPVERLIALREIRRLKKG